MGGFGSGLWQTRKTTTGESKQLDIRFLRKQGSLFSGNIGTLSWSVDNKPSGSIGYTVKKESIVLNYDCTIHGETSSIKQTIYFETTACHYGGERKWFLCPDCHKRKEVLYLHGKYFTCRKCADLAYQCQQEDSLYRNYRQAKKIRRKLNTKWFNPDDLSEPVIFKPKGMHQKTFDKLRLKQEKRIDVSMRDLTRMAELLFN